MKKDVEWTVAWRKEKAETRVILAHSVTETKNTAVD